MDLSSAITAATSSGVTTFQTNLAAAVPYILGLAVSAGIAKMVFGFVKRRG